MRYVVHNLRAGFATNSSSSHSVVLLPESYMSQVKDEDVPEDAGFGTNDFCLVSTTSKMRYLAAQLFCEAMDDEQTAAFIEMFKPHVPEIEELMGDRDGYYGFYIDHQSVWDVRPAGFHRGFAQALMKVLLDKRIVIRGGSDSGPHDYGIPGHITESVPLIDIVQKGYRTRTRTDGPYFVAFNTEKGTKLRLSEEGAPEYLKASTPELVDLKITDYCAAGCNFCYQSSTTKGKHADLDVVLRVVETLKACEVFEVALGGGETTDHPDFARIVTAVNKSGMVCNFTTMSNRWLSDPEKVDAVCDNVSAIGVSCSSAKSLDLVDEIRAGLVRTRPSWDKKSTFTVEYRGVIMAQHVVGSVPLWVTAEFINEAAQRRIPVLLLGFKEVGFGQDYVRHDEGQDVAFFLRMAVKDLKSGLSADTALLNQYPELPKLLGAPPELTTSPEGKFSCYVDAVTERMAASSYVDPATMDRLPADLDGFRSCFAAY